jgi:hypothetical protein
VLALLVPAFLSPAPAQIPPRLQEARAPAPVYDPDMVLVHISVMASGNAAAPRLGAADFRIEEDGVEQKIEYFAVQDQAMTIGIVWGAGTAFDDPGPDHFVRECPREFLRNSPPGSEFFVLAGDTVLKSFMTNVEQTPLNFALSASSTDSLYIGLDVLKEAAHPRKILFVVTNSSGGGGGQLEPAYMESVAIKQSAQIYVASFATDTDTNLAGFNLFGELTDLTGGSFYFGPPSSVYCANLAKELRMQYLVGYHSTNPDKDGSWRRLSARVAAPDGAPKLRTRIKRGYYAAKAR